MEAYERYEIQCAALVDGHYCETRFSVPGFTLIPGYDREVLSQKPLWPEENWNAQIACPLCGSIRGYHFADVNWWHDEVAPDPEFFIHVAMECSRPDCRVPVEFYIVDFDAIAEEQNTRFSANHEREKWIAETDWKKQIREEKFHGHCKHSHALLPIPSLLYLISIRQGFLPSQHDLLQWRRGNP